MGKVAVTTVQHTCLDLVGIDAVGPAKPIIYWIPELFSLVFSKVAGVLCLQLTPSCAVIKNVEKNSYTPSPPQYTCMAWCLINERKDFPGVCGVTGLSYPLGLTGNMLCIICHILFHCVSCSSFI